MFWNISHSNTDRFLPIYVQLSSEICMTNIKNLHHEFFHRLPHSWHKEPTKWVGISLDPDTRTASCCAPRRHGHYHFGDLTPERNVPSHCLCIHTEWPNLSTCIYWYVQKYPNKKYSHCKNAHWSKNLKRKNACFCLAIENGILNSKLFNWIGYKSQTVKRRWFDRISIIYCQYNVDISNKTRRIVFRYWYSEPVKKSISGLEFFILKKDGGWLPSLSIIFLNWKTPATGFDRISIFHCQINIDI